MSRVSPPRGRLSRFARTAARDLGRRQVPLRRLLLPAAVLGALALVLRLAYLGDAAPTLHTAEQHGVRMAVNYTEAANAILAGDGLLYPRVWPHPSETRLVSRPPGYPVFVAAAYRLVGPGYMDVLASQAVLSSLVPGLVLLLVSRVAGGRAGIVAGALAALSPPLGYHASIMTPDWLCALLVLLVVYFVWSAGRGRSGAAWLAAAGLTLGVATWLRPNFLLLAPFLGLALPLTLARWRRLWPGAAGMVALAFALVVPITVRNARLYGVFLPVSANGGIVLWEGIADAGGESFGARSRDMEVAQEEASRFSDPRYARSWATPDGIRRDRDRVERSLQVIRAHPWWYAASVVRRTGEVLASEREAPLVRSHPPELASGSSPVSHPALRAAAALAFTRPALRLLQGLAAAATGVLSLAGLALFAILVPRRTLLLVLVPVYVLLVHAPMHFEPRFALPKDAFGPAFAAIGLVAAAGAMVRQVRRRRGSAR